MGNFYSQKIKYKKIYTLKLIIVYTDADVYSFHLPDCFFNTLLIAIRLKGSGAEGKGG